MWVLAGLQLARLAWNLYQRHALEAIQPRLAPEPGRQYPLLSVVVPARNEAANIAACVGGARAQRYKDLEIVIVDDRSDDGTGNIAREAAAGDQRVRVVEGQPLPEGWVGKCWALHQGAQLARGEWLLFVDADTRLLPGAALGAIEAAQSRGVAVLSALTAQLLPTVWERVVQPAVFMSLAEAMPVTLVNNPRLPQFAIANGQFLLVRRDAYEALGGHAAIRNEIAEDAQFARRAKLLGQPFWLGDGRALATTRMYATPRDLWEGWTKNLHVGQRLLPWLVPPGTALLAASLVAPWASLAAGWWRRDPSLAGAGLAQLACALAGRRAIDESFGVPPAYTLAQPLGQAVFLALLVSSFYKVASGKGVTWKGRRYTG